MARNGFFKVALKRIIIQLQNSTSNSDVVHGAHLLSMSGEPFNVFCKKSRFDSQRPNSWKRSRFCLFLVVSYKQTLQQFVTRTSFVVSFSLEPGFLNLD
jgi:hypothetical protein